MRTCALYQAFEQGPLSVTVLVSVLSGAVFICLMGFSMQEKNAEVWSPTGLSPYDFRQVTSPPWASMSPLHKREIVFQAQPVSRGHQRGVD